jgi:hypothetical protein
MPFLHEKPQPIDISNAITRVGVGLDPTKTTPIYYMLTFHSSNIVKNWCNTCYLTTAWVVVSFLLIGFAWICKKKQWCPNIDRLECKLSWCELLEKKWTLIANEILTWHWEEIMMTRENINHLFCLCWSSSRHLLAVRKLKYCWCRLCLSTSYDETIARIATPNVMPNA